MFEIEDETGPLGEGGEPDILDLIDDALSRLGEGEATDLLADAAVEITRLRENLEHHQRRLAAVDPENVPF